MDSAGNGNGRLDGKVVVISGTAGGQGREAAILFAREGAKIVGCDFKTDGADETVEMVKAVGGEMTSLQPLDLCEEDQAKQLIDHAIETHGRIDVLYNNAGALRTGLAESMSKEDLEYTFASEVIIAWLPTKYAIPVMREQGGGTVINVGSIAGMATGTGTTGNARSLFGHTICKAAVIRMTSHLATELASDGIRVNCISPGIVLTPTTVGMLGDESSPIRSNFMEHLLIQRIGEPIDIAKVALFLASDDSGYMTGVNLPVDGGWTASGGMGQPRADVEKAFEESLQGFSTSGVELGGDQ